MKRIPREWIVPEWPVPPNIKAFITTRHGGASRGPYAAFNLGLKTGDDPRAVHANRAYLRTLLPQEPKWLDQEHAATVAEVDDIATVPRADASIARRPGTVCAIMVADCVPVLMTDERGTLVAAAHAGWRGLARGVIENTVQATGLAPGTLLAYLGPGIGPGAFEVGADVREAFLSRGSRSAEAFSPCGKDKWLADLFTLVRHALERVGVQRIYGGGLCTVSDARRFYSYRRDRITGRMAALIWRDS